MICKDAILAKLEHREDGLYWTNNRLNALNGQRVGALDKDGYRVLNLGRKKVKEHRLIYFLVYGIWPDKVDHFDGDVSNNRIENLRPATTAENAQNSKVRRNGLKGVSYDKHNKSWKAQIRVNGKNLHLGSYKTEEDAARAYDTNAVRYFGTFARGNVK